MAASRDPFRDLFGVGADGERRPAIYCHGIALLRFNSFVHPLAQPAHEPVYLHLDWERRPAHGPRDLLPARCDRPCFAIPFRRGRPTGNAMPLGTRLISNGLSYLTAAAAADPCLGLT